WDERGDGSLTEATASIFGAAWRLEKTVIFAIGRVRGELTIVVGLEDCDSRTTRDLLSSLLPGLRATPIESAPAERSRAAQRVVATRPEHWAVVGVPRLLETPPAVPLLERLAACTFDDWSFWLRAAPLSIGGHLAQASEDADRQVSAIGSLVDVSVRV